MVTPIYRHVVVAIPAMDELYTLPQLLHCIDRQTMQPEATYLCVNQPDSWWGDNIEEHSNVCANNACLMHYVTTEHPDVVLIDRSSEGNGWRGRKTGVGEARKVLFSRIIQDWGNDTVVVSLDADTTFSDTYFEQLLDAFNANKGVNAVQVPYYHKLSTGNDEQNRRLLRYECYMRHYFINMLEINNPHAISALGSAMAFTTEAYRRCGGISSMQAGEDFYLTQRFAKTGLILCNLRTVVNPSGRVSSRVPFGTGPAVSLSVELQEQRYPFYPAEAFALVKDTYTMFPALYDGDTETPMSYFLQKQFRCGNLWAPLRNNFRTRELFVRACAEKVDGLRILQFLHEVGPTLPVVQPPVDFATDPISVLDSYRNTLFARELSLRETIRTVGLG